MTAQTLFVLEPIGPAHLVPDGRWGLEQFMPAAGTWSPCTIAAGYEHRSDADTDVAKLAAGGYRFRVFDRFPDLEVSL